MNVGKDKLVGGEDKPIGGEDKLIGGEDKQISGEDKPIGGEDKPVSGEDKPVSGEDKLVGGEDKPVSGEDKSISGEDNLINSEDSQEKLLEFLRKPKSTKEVADFLEINSLRYVRERILSSMLQKDLVRLTIPEKPTSRNQKYIINYDRSQLREHNPHYLNDAKQQNKQHNKQNAINQDFIAILDGIRMNLPDDQLIERFGITKNELLTFKTMLSRKEAD